MNGSFLFQFLQTKHMFNSLNELVIKLVTHCVIKKTRRVTKETRRVTKETRRVTKLYYVERFFVRGC
jgi:hypothetical protein